VKKQQPCQVYLSLIIPAFNEENRIRESLDRILSFLQSQPYTWEVIVVDDGSQDRTEELVRERFRNRTEARIYRQPGNLGKGEAVKRGMLLGRGEFLFFSDADLSVPIETIATFLPYLEHQFDVSIGTRQKTGAAIEIHQPRPRELLGKAYTRLTDWMLGLRLSDLTCGFKGFRREVALELFSRQQLKKWSFDAEILFLTKVRNYRVIEIPVRWRNNQATKVRLWRDIIGSLIELLQIRVYHYRGRYK